MGVASATCQMRSSPVVVPAASKVPSELTARQRIQVKVLLKRQCVSEACERFASASSTVEKFASRIVKFEQSMPCRSVCKYVSKFKMFPAAYTDNCGLPSCNFVRSNLSF